MSKVKDIIEHLEEMPHDEQICVTLWTKEQVEELLNTNLTTSQWHKCIKTWDNDNQSDQWQWIVAWAREKATA